MQFMKHALLLAMLILGCGGGDEMLLSDAPFDAPPADSTTTCVDDAAGRLCPTACEPGTFDEDACCSALGGPGECSWCSHERGSFIWLENHVDCFAPLPDAAVDGPT